MSFRYRKIRKRPPLHLGQKGLAIVRFFSALLGRFSGKQKSYAAGGILLILAFYVVFQAMMGVYHAIRGFDPKDLVFALGTDLKTDQSGYVNVVLLGDGGHVRDGADLIDSIMVVSIDPLKGAVSLLSIPRDYYVGDMGYEATRINELYRNYKSSLGENGAYAVYEKAAGHIANLDIPYFVRVDFKAFVEIIDAIGGVTVDVKNAIDDPYYPNATDDGYDPFHIGAGLQELDGETALKFARSRKTTSDFDRASRQQQVLEAIWSKALAKETLLSPKTIKNVYGAVRKNINTNLELRELIALAEFAKKLDRSHVISKVLNDDPGQEGGFLYTPERQYYNGQFVLIPDGNNLDLIHRYADLMFNHRDVYLNKAKISLLNATKTPGIARKIASHLWRFGFDIQTIDNEVDAKGERIYLPKSLIRFNRWHENEASVQLPDHQSTLDVLKSFVKGEVISGDALRAMDIEIVLGDDFEAY